MLSALLLLLPLIATAAPSEPLPKPDETVDEATRRILTTKSFPFCTKSEAALPPDERFWCDIQDQASVCPELKEMCGRKWEAKSFFGSLFSHQAGKVDSESAGGALDRFDWLPNFHLPGAQLIFWIVVGVMTAVLIFVVIRAIRERRTAVPVAIQEELPTGAVDLPDPGLGEVGRLLAQARREVDRDVGRALMLLYAAILRHLEDRRLIQWDVTTTNREYVRAVRGKTPLDRPMAEVVREVERTKFGRVAPSRATFEVLYEKVSQLVSTMGLLIVLVGIAGCHGCEPGEAGLDGHAAISDILRSQGIAPSRLSVPLESLSGKDAPVILDSKELLLDAATLKSIEKSANAGARIMVLMAPTTWLESWPGIGVAETEDELIEPVEVEEPESVELSAGETADGGESCAPSAPDAPAEAHKLEPGPPITARADWELSNALTSDTVGFIPGAWRMFLPADDKEVPDILLERGGEPFAARWKKGDGRVIFVADRRLFSNGAMAVPTNARLAVALTRDLVGDKHEVSYGALTMSRAAESPSASLMNAGLLAFMLQMLAVLAVAFAARGLAFGLLRDRTTQGRRAFSEHVRALGLQFARVRGSRYAAAQYASYALDRFRVRIGHDIDREGGMATVLAQRISRPLEEVQATLSQAEAMRREPNGISIPTTDLALIQRLGDYLNALQRDA